MRKYSCGVYNTVLGCFTEYEKIMKMTDFFIKIKHDSN